MTTITIDELETRLREVVDRIASGGEPVSITRDGVAVAEINPTVAVTTESGGTASPQSPTWTEEQRETYWAEWERIGVEIGKTWPEGVSAVDAIREDRSRLDAVGGDRREL